MVTRVFGFFVMPRFSLRSLYSLHELPNRRCSTRRVERLIDPVCASRRIRRAVLFHVRDILRAGNGINQLATPYGIRRCRIPFLLG